MANSIGYNSEKMETAIGNLKKVESSLADLYVAMIRYDSSLNSVERKIGSRIESMATKYDEDDKPYVDSADERYYQNNYGTPLKNAIKNIEVLKNATPGIKARITAVSNSFTAVKNAVALYEEIPAVKNEDLGLPKNDHSASDASNGSFDKIVAEEGVGKADLVFDTVLDGTGDKNQEGEDTLKADINIDINGDGIPDLNIDINGDGKADINIDTNGDGKADFNIDTNGDGKADLNIDTNGDGKPDLNIDTDGDGKADLNIDTNGDGIPDLNVDTNGDGKADVDIDSNDDGREDTNVDTDGDGQAETNIDTNGDGIPDINIDIDGDGQADVNVDINGDGIPDINIDTNGDGIADTNIDADGNGIIDSEEKKKPPVINDTPSQDPEDKPTDPNVDPNKPGDKPGDDKKEDEAADDLVNIGEVVIPDIGGGDNPQQDPGVDGGNKGAGTISNIGTAIADSITSVEDELIGSVVEEETQSIPDALLGGNGTHGMSAFDASGSYKNAQGPAAQAGVGIAGVAALGIAAASGGTAISGIIEENNEDSDLTNDELNKRKRIRTIITSCSLVVLSLGFTLTQILRPGSVITILLFGIAILISAVASIFGTNIGKTITTVTSLVLLFVTFLLSALNVVSPLGYIIALIALLTIFLIVYIFDLFKEFVDNKVMIPSFVAIVALNAFGLLKVFNVVNWLIYLLLAGLGIAVYLWYERYYGQGFEVVNKLKNEDKRKFFY